MMLLPIPIPVALVCPAYLIDDDADLKDMPLASIHKEALAALKKAGYKRTRVEANYLTISGSAIEVDLLSPDGKEKIALTFNTDDDSTVDRETLVPETKAAAYARYRPLLKEKFPNIELLCFESRGKTYAAVRVELSEASPKNVMEALAETKRALAFIEANRGVARTRTQGDNPTDLKALPLTDNQKAVFNALEKSGYKRVRVTSDGGVEDKYVTLDPPGSDFKIFAYVSPRRMRLQRSLDVTDSEKQATARARPIPEKFPGMTAKVYDLLGRISITLEVALSDSEATPTRALDAVAALGRGMAFLKETPTPVPTDPLGKTLEASKLIYTDIGKFYKLQYDASDTKRRQFVYVRKDVYNYNSLNVQEVYSLCYDSPDAPSAALLEKTFLKSFSIGGLVLEAPSETQKNWRIRFKLDAPTDLPPATLSTYLQIAQSTADVIEKELNPDKGDLL